MAAYTFTLYTINNERHGGAYWSIKFVSPSPPENLRICRGTKESFQWTSRRFREGIRCSVSIQTSDIWKLSRIVLRGKCFTAVRKNPPRR